MITAKEARAIAEYAIYNGDSDIVLDMPVYRATIIATGWSILRKARSGYSKVDFEINADSDSLQKALRYYKRLGYDIQQDGNKVTIKWGE